MSSIAFIFFFFNDTATTEIYTLSLHDALPISYLLWSWALAHLAAARVAIFTNLQPLATALLGQRSEEHTSELQSLAYLVCRLLLEKKKIHIDLRLDLIAVDAQICSILAQTNAD